MPTCSAKAFGRHSAKGKKGRIKVSSYKAPEILRDAAVSEQGHWRQTPEFLEIITNEGDLLFPFCWWEKKSLLGCVSIPHPNNEIGSHIYLWWGSKFIQRAFKSTANSQRVVCWILYMRGGACCWVLQITQILQLTCTPFHRNTSKLQLRKTVTERQLMWPLWRTNQCICHAGRDASRPPPPHHHLSLGWSWY